MEEVIDILGLVSPMLELKAKHLWLDYDDKADVLYMSLHKPQRAIDSEMKGSLIYHYADQELVGITVLHAKVSASEQASL